MCIDVTVICNLEDSSLTGGNNSLAPGRCSQTFASNVLKYIFFKENLHVLIQVYRKLGIESSMKKQASVGWGTCNGLVPYRRLGIPCTNDDAVH